MELNHRKALLYTSLLFGAALVVDQHKEIGDYLSRLRPTIKVEDLPNRWDSPEQKAYASYCTGCHDTPGFMLGYPDFIPVMSEDGKLAKSRRNATVDDIVQLLQNGEHSLNLKGFLSDKELGGASAYILLMQSK